MGRWAYACLPRISGSPPPTTPSMGRPGTAGRTLAEVARPHREVHCRHTQGRPHRGREPRRYRPPRRCRRRRHRRRAFLEERDHGEEVTGASAVGGAVLAIEAFGQDPHRNAAAVHRPCRSGLLGEDLHYHMALVPRAGQKVLSLQRPDTRAVTSSGVLCQRARF
jgi:hypothetical protein